MFAGLAADVTSLFEECSKLFLLIEQLNGAISWVLEEKKEPKASFRIELSIFVFVIFTRFSVL